MGLDPPVLPYTSQSENSSLDELEPVPKTSSTQSIPRLEGRMAGGAASTGLLWEKEPDDFLHSYDPELEKMMDRQISSKFSWIAFINTASLIVVIVVIIGLFAG